MFMHLADIEVGTDRHEYSIAVLLYKGEEAHFGSYVTKDELLTEVKPFFVRHR